MFKPVVCLLLIILSTLLFATSAAPQVTSAPVLPVLSGTTAAIGGGALLAGACTSGTATVTGATTSMSAIANPNTYPGDGIVWTAQVTSANTVTIKVCGILALTPTSSTYNVRVVQ